MPLKDITILAKNNIKIPAKLLLHPWHFFSLGFGSGLSPVAPGTMGTLAAIPIYLLCSNLALELYLALTMAGFVIGVYWCGFTSKSLGVHDHGGIVWDEIVGFFITMILVPPTITNIVLGFILFRIFDIWKPWPIKVLDEKVHGGFGIMIDDVIAGLFAWGILHLILLFNLEHYV